MTPRIAIALVCSLSALVARPAGAIPAFARAHSYSCNTCHAPIPKLTEFGEEFAGNAFAPSDEPLPPRYFKDVGDDRLSLLRNIPVAVRADMFADVRFNGDDRGDGYNDLKVPFGLKLLSGGRIADNIGYYFYFYMSEHGEIAGIEDAYLHFNDLFDIPLDVFVGQFQTSDPLFKRELRLTFQDYLVYKVRPGESHTDLTYDRGVMLTAGFDFGLDVTALVVNGNGKEEADVRKDFDIDRYKNGMLRLSQSVGPVRIGVFGYYGREQSEVDGRRRNNYVAMVGPDLTVKVGPVEVNGQYILRRDTNPGFRPAGEWEEATVHSILAEAIIQLAGEPGVLYGVLLYNYVDNDELLLTADNAERAGNQESYTANLTYLLHTNVKAMVEYTFAWMVNGQNIEEHRLTLGLVAAM